MSEEKCYNDSHVICPNCKKEYWVSEAYEFPHEDYTVIECNYCEEPFGIYTEHVHEIYFTSMSMAKYNEYMAKKRQHRLDWIEKMKKLEASE